MQTNELRALYRAIDTIQKALAGQSYESAVKICGGKVYDEVRDICAKLVGIADAFAGGVGNGGGSSVTAGDIADAVSNHNTSTTAHSDIRSLLSSKANTSHSHVIADITNWTIVANGLAQSLLEADQLILQAANEHTDQEAQRAQNAETLLQQNKQNTLSPEHLSAVNSGVNSDIIDVLQSAITALNDFKNRAAGFAAAAHTHTVGAISQFSTGTFSIETPPNPAESKTINE